MASHKMAVVAVLFLYHSSASSMMSFNFYRSTQCQPLRIPACRKLGYNQTRIPSDLYPSMPFQAVKKYIELLDSIKCSKDALFFLCNMYSPVCFAGYVPRVLPCRSVCKSVRKGCLPYINVAGFKWPSELDCRRLPDYNTGVCIQPSAIVRRQGNRHKNKKLQKEKTEKCSKCKPMAQLKRYKKFKKAAFAIEAEVKSRITTANKNTKLIVSIKRIYKQGKVKIHSGIAKIWSSSRCICPALDFDRRYIILGQEDRRRKRLVYDHKTIIVKSSSFLKKKLSKWRSRYRKMVARKLKRKANV